jgi:hypothetical protein
MQDPTNGLYHTMWLTHREEYSNYLHQTAMRLFHPLIMDTQRIVEVGAPIGDLDAANKSYVDSRTNICSTTHPAAGEWLGQTWYSNGASTKAIYYWIGTWQQVQ